ncbi:MAG: hypothetical protein KDI76_12210 [Xanthomonadales bacterium]|nr:hypothetical protein [Xanthomonadales bacterium]
MPNDKGAGDVGNTCGGAASTDGTGTVVNQFVACAGPGLSALNTNCNDGLGTEHSFTRAIPVTDEDATDISGDYFVDIQVPVEAIRDNTGCYSYPGNFSSTETLVEGNQVVFDPSTLAMWFSTSNSGEDPLQKDYIGNGFGDEVPTPITLKSFEATQLGNNVKFSWQTLTEVSNAGFNIYAKTEFGLEKVNSELIYSKAVSSMDVINYEFIAPSSVGDSFVIEEVSIEGKSQKFGTYELNKTYGNKGELTQINWQHIQQEHKIQQTVTEGRNASRVSDTLNSFNFSDGQIIANVEVTESGIQKISDTDLLNLGIDLAGLDKTRLSISDNYSKPLALVVESPNEMNADVLFSADFDPDLFERGDSILFVANIEETLYSNTGHYQLSIGETKLALKDNSSIGNEFPEYYMADAIADENLLYSVSATTGDPWYKARLLTSENNSNSWNFNISIDNLYAGSVDSTLNLNAWGGTMYANNPDHHLMMELNGNSLLDVRFDGLQVLDENSEINSTHLFNGDNTVRITLPGDNGVRYDLVNLESLKLSYPRNFVAVNDNLRFTSQGSEQYQIQGFDNDQIYAFRSTEDKLFRLRAVVEPSLTTGYNVKVPGDFNSSVYYVASESAVNRPLLSLHIANELPTVDNDLLVIYHADFYDGIQPLVQARTQQGLSVVQVDVQDIYDNLSMGAMDAYAIKAFIENQITQFGTKYVLLVGGDTYDYKNYSGNNPVSFIPSIYQHTSDIIRHVPLDSQFADTNGDRVPDAAIGRLPVRTVSELDIVVNKILNFPSVNVANDLVLAADKGFIAVSDQFVNDVSGTWDAETIYLDQLSIEDAQSSLISSINEGKKLVSYFGHSGSSAWSFSGLLDSNDVSSLANVGKPSTVMQWGCWNNYYVHPSYNTMSHSFLLTEDVGAAAVLGSVTLTYSNTQKELMKHLSGYVAKPNMLIGDVMQRAKQAVNDSRPEFTDVIVGWILLGDPTMPFNQ